MAGPRRCDRPAMPRAGGLLEPICQRPGRAPAGRGHPRRIGCACPGRARRHADPLRPRHLLGRGLGRGRTGRPGDLFARRPGRADDAAARHRGGAQCRAAGLAARRDPAGGRPDGRDHRRDAAGRGRGPGCHRLVRPPAAQRHLPGRGRADTGRHDLPAARLDQLIAAAPGDFLPGRSALHRGASNPEHRPMTDATPDPMKILAGALPFLKRYDDQIVVVKYGGHAMGEEETALRFGRDIALLEQVGVNPVVVHGGGPQINAMLKRLNVQSTFVHGLRVTDEAMLDVVEMVLAGPVNKQVAEAITRAGAIAVGISGKDGGLVRARKLTRRVRDPENGAEQELDLGYVGEPESVDTKVLKLLIGADIVPVVAPVGVGADGQTYNINADTVAGAIAGALGAERLLMLTDVSGVKGPDGKLIPEMTVAEVKAGIEAGWISGGMIPKVETCIYAIEKGVKAAVILDGRVPHAVLHELFTDGGAGTLVKP